MKKFTKMKNKNLTMPAFCRHLLFDEAKSIFLADCRFDLETEKHKRMMELAMKIHEEGKHGIKIRAALAEAEEDAYENQQINIEGQSLKAWAFSRVADENVKSIYLYILTVGECICEDKDNVAKQLYAYMWGSAYAEAARKMVVEEIEKAAELEFPNRMGKELFLSPAFGPGFYGMPLEASHAINQLLKGEKLGIEVKESGVMLPLKTCAGIHLVVKDKQELPQRACMACAGTASGCAYCKIIPQE